MILVDASGSDSALHRRALEALLAAADQPLGRSPVTLAEVLVGPARADRLPDARCAITDLGVDEIPLGDEAAGRLAELRAETALKMPDCCVLLAAEDAPADAVLTFDDGLARAAERRRLQVV